MFRIIRERRRIGPNGGYISPFRKRDRYPTPSQYGILNPFHLPTMFAYGIGHQISIPGFASPFVYTPDPVILTIRWTMS